MINEREVCFKGMVYVIEEEVYSDSDKSSIYSSEDELEVSKEMKKMFAKVYPLLNKELAIKAHE